MPRKFSLDISLTHHLYLLIWVNVRILLLHSKYLKHANTRLSNFWNRKVVFNVRKINYFKIPYLMLNIKLKYQTVRFEKYCEIVFLWILKWGSLVETLDISGCIYSTLVKWCTTNVLTVDHLHTKKKNKLKSLMS